jgi:hypothetical protein
LLNIDAFTRTNPKETYIYRTVAALLLCMFLSQPKILANDSLLHFTCTVEVLSDATITENPLPYSPESHIIEIPAGNPQPRQTTSVFRRKRTKVGERELGIGGNVLGPTMNYASAYLQYSFSRVLQAESGLDLSTVYAGFNLFPRIIEQIEGLSPYMGLMIGYSDPDNLKTANGIYAYMPVGIRYVTRADWYMCLEFAATTADNVRSSPFFLGVKLGLLFRRD